MHRGTVAVTADTTAKAMHSGDAVKKQIRGSGLLLAGRILSTFIGFVSQILIIRHLSTSDFGAFGYGLSIVMACNAFSTLGIHKSLSRFVPIYQEQRDRPKLAGAILLAIIVVFVALLTVALSVLILPHVLHSMSHTRQATIVVATLLFLVPLNALNDVLISLLASFGRAREIFFRTHVLGPLLRLATVVALILTNASVVFLALGYLISGFVGSLICALVLLRFCRRQRLFAGLRPSDIRLPVREMFSFSLPILSSEFVTGGMMTAMGAIVIGHFYPISEVAILQAALPAARMNVLVMASFSLLFMPVAAKLFARAQYEGINELYWRTTTWIALLTFPMFLATFSFSRPLVLFLYGPRYEATANVLAILALGYYFNVTLGFNSLTLRVFGRLRSILVVNFAAVAVNLALTLVLVPRFGATGAAIATASTLIFLNVATQCALRSAPGFRVFDLSYAPIHIFVIATGFALFAVQASTGMNVYLCAILGLGTCAFIFVRCRKHLRIAESFPELMKFPVLRTILS
jgi:O-antigen/teichoic acid export membrane protein